VPNLLQSHLAREAYRTRNAGTRSFWTRQRSLQTGTGSGPFAPGLAGSFTGSVYLSGNLTVRGSILAGGKDLKIDRPLDPANTYLVHYSLESSEMMDIYTGNVTLDPNGVATVQLSDSFETLNTDFR